jgi:SRSO17 transposase
MERRFSVRMERMLAECESSPKVLEGALERLKDFVEPFGLLLMAKAQREHARDYVSGLISDLPRKNVESIAYRHDQDRKNLQHFIGFANWDHQVLIQEVARQVGQEIGEEDGVIVFDPSAFPKQGNHSVGVARQWCGRLGKLDNCQVAVYMAYVSREDRVLVNTRLYLPKEWTQDRRRCKAVGVPKQVKFQTRHQQSLEMLKEQRHLLPHSWVAGDDEMGRNSAFRRDLHEQNEQYLLAVPCNTMIRDLEAPPPQAAPRGAPAKAPFQRVDAWRDALPKEAWTKIGVRDGEKGPLGVEVAVCRVQTKIAQRIMSYEETLVIIRYVDHGKVTKHDFYLSDAPRETSKHEFARVALSAHRVEEAIKRGKSETGLADYEVRNWRGWHHHQALSLMASWFLSQESRRGKKIHPGDHAPPSSPRHCDAATGPMCLLPTPANRQQPNPPPHTKRNCEVLSLQET